jgi:RNA polymerase sigma-70 factor (ECF subfamily)
MEPELRHTRQMADEIDLLRRARALEAAALASIYDEHSPRLYRYAWRLLGNDNLAEDCVAETFTSFLHVLAGGGGPRDHLQAYLYRTAHNWITDHYRRQPASTEELAESLADDTPGPAVQADLVERQHRVRQALYKLTPEQRQVIALKYMEGCCNEEIARSLGKPVGAIKALQHRALAALRRLLPEEEFGQ